MATDPETERDPFLDHLRDRIEGAELMPSPQVWSGLSGKLPVPNPWLTRYVGGGVGLGVIVGLLLGWFVRQSPSSSLPTPAQRQTLVVSATPQEVQNTVKSPVVPVQPQALAMPVPERVITRTRIVRVPINTPAAAVTAIIPSATAPASESVALPPPVRVQPLAALWHSALVLDSAIQHESTPVQGESIVATTRRHDRVIALVADQQPVLLALNDQLSHLQENAHTALTEIPPALAADSVHALPTAVHATSTDSTRRPTLAPERRWAAMLIVETSNAWGTLPGYNPATTQEKIFGANTQTANFEYRPASRWRMRAGFGETQLRDQFRFTHDSLHHTAHHDTTWAFQTNVTITHDTTYSVRLDSLGRPEPIINQQGQVIGYHTVYEHYYDTTYQITTRHDTVRQMQENVHVREELRNERRLQDLRPNYKFWTVPLAMQFDLIRRPRWSAGVVVGGQVLIFRGGNQPVRDRTTGTYILRPIGANEGPFRQVSFALSTGLDIRYRLSDRLSLMAGGNARGWALGPLKTGSLPRWTLGVQGGLSWEMGR